MTSAIYIDGPSIYTITKEHKVDFKKLISWVLQGRTGTTTQYFNITTNKENKENNFFAYLRAIGIQTNIKKSKEFRKGSIMVKIAVKAIAEMQEIDDYIFITDDFEILTITTELKARGKYVEIVGTEKAHPLLRQLYPFRPIEEYIKKEEREK
jgi:uncharacterized LabA/DUF88 family protein